MRLNQWITQDEVERFFAAEERIKSRANEILDLYMKASFKRYQQSYYRVYDWKFERINLDDEWDMFRGLHYRWAFDELFLPYEWLWIYDELLDARIEAELDRRESH